MAVIKAVSSHAPIKVAIQYVTRREKTHSCLVSGFACNPDTAMEEMEATKRLYGKLGGRTYKHFVQSFAPGEAITSEKAHELAKEFASRCEIFRGYEVLIATHEDRDHIHTHYIVNSVNYENGYKFQMSAKDLQRMKDVSDGLCKEYHLSICEKGKTFDGEVRTQAVAYTKEKYQFLLKETQSNGKLYLNEMAVAVAGCKEQATTRDEFVDLMKERGYTVDWKDNHKYITFHDACGHKIRDKNLNRTFHMDIGKEQLESVFIKNRQRSYEERLQELYGNVLKSEYKARLHEVAYQEMREGLQQSREHMAYVLDVKKHTKSTVEQIKSRVEQWEQSLDQCPMYQFRRKDELKLQIEHGRMQIDSLKAYEEAVCGNYGLDTPNALKEAVTALGRSEKQAEVLERTIQQIRNNQTYEVEAFKHMKEISSTLELSNLQYKQINDKVCAGLKEEYGDEIQNDYLRGSQEIVHEKLGLSIGGDPGAVKINDKEQEMREGIRRI